MVKYALPEESNTILASKYKLYLPNKKELTKEFEKLIDDAENEEEADGEENERRERK